MLVKAEKEGLVNIEKLSGFIAGLGFNSAIDQVCSATLIFSSIYSVAKNFEY